MLDGWRCSCVQCRESLTKEANQGLCASPGFGPRKNNAEGDGLSKNPYTLIDDDFQTSAAGVDSEGGVDTGVATTRLAGEPLLPLRGAVCVWSASPEGTPPMSNRLLVVSSIEPMNDLPAAIHDSLGQMVSGLNDAHPGIYTSAVMVPTLLP